MRYWLGDDPIVREGGPIDVDADGEEVDLYVWDANDLNDGHRVAFLKATLTRSEALHLASDIHRALLD